MTLNPIPTWLRTCPAEAGGTMGERRRMPERSRLPERPWIAAIALVVTIATAPSARQNATAGDAAGLLRGAIDIHVHSDPDNVPRSIDGLDAAKMARASGMRGIVLKNHYDSTAGLAFLARK